jgi:hypothetical protein
MRGKGEKMETERKGSSYKELIQIVHRGGATRSAVWYDWLSANTPNLRASCRLHLGELAGIVTFSLGHGWAAKPCDDWRIADDDLEKLRVWAEEACGRKIGVVPRSTGRPKGPKRAKITDPRQIALLK